MRRLLPLLALLVAACRSVPAGSPTLTAFEDVVLSMRNDEAVPGQTVVVRDGVIERLGDVASTPVPRGATRIAGRGRFLMPGLIDFHVHLRSPDELVSYLAYGVTTVVHTSAAEPGAADLFRIRSEVESGTLVGPALYFSGPLIDGPRPIFPRLAVSAETEQDARRIVAQQRAAGYDFLKTYVMLPPAAYRELMRAAHEQKMAVIGHTPARLTLGDALAAGHDLFLHVGDFVFSTRLYDPKSRRISEDPAEIAAIAGAAARAGAAVAPTMVADLAMIRKIRDRERLLSDPETRHLHPDAWKIWRTDTHQQPLWIESHPITLKITAALHQAGVPLLVGTDAAGTGIFPGRSVHEELELLRNAGLTPIEALAAATRTPGRFLERHVPGAHRVGVVAPGARADLLLVDGDPRAIVAFAPHVSGVMAGGRWYAAGDLRARRERLAASYATGR